MLDRKALAMIFLKYGLWDLEAAKTFIDKETT